MKTRILSLLLVLALVCALLPQIVLPANAADITINATNFPDDNFRAYVSQYIDEDKDNKLSASEIASTTEINVGGYLDGYQLTSLKGIEYFTALTDLNCGYNQLTALDVSKNTSLEYLNCYNNQLTALDVSKNTALEDLSCDFNQLTALDVSKNTALTRLDCDSNQLTALDVSKNTSLDYLDCSSNQLTALDVSKNTSLEYLICDSNQLTALDVSKNTALYDLDCSSNQLTALDVSKNTSLKYLGCASNQLTALDVSKNTSLTELYCYYNQLTALDVSKNTSLLYLYCYSNQLTSLDVSKNTALTKLDCSSNQLTALDVSKNTSLKYLGCASNQLTALDVSKNTALTRLYCYGNQIALLDVSASPALVDAITNGGRYERVTEAGVPYVIYGSSEGIVGMDEDQTGLLDPAAPPTITTQPKSVTVDLGATATFKVVAFGSGLKYQWQYMKSGATSWTDWSGKTAATLTVTASSTNGGCQYRCKVSNAGGTVYSSAATLTVTTAAKPTITTQPKSASVGIGESVTFTCSATGEGTLSYQWQYKKAGESSWTNWSGATRTYFSVKGSATNNQCQYRCVVTNEGGSVNSSAATLSVASGHNCPGAPFTDMPAFGTIEHTAIDWAVVSGITKGTSGTTFGPQKTVTRGQVVTFLWRAVGSPEPKTTKNPFTDVSASSYCYKAVLWANENNITNGTSATTFSPNKTCSRAHILTFLYRQQGSPSVGSVTVPYTDVKAGAFYEAAMKWAYKNGIDKGVSATKFAPGADCTRVSTVVFLYRAITGQGKIS